MKRSSSSLDYDQTNRNDNELFQEPTAKNIRKSSSSIYEKTQDRSIQNTKFDQKDSNKLCADMPHNSIILGSFRQPTTYVIHFLDSNLTFVENFQICSLYGRARIHGCNLRPSQFYTVYNSRTNSPVSIESSDSTVDIKVENIENMIPDSQLAYEAFGAVNEKGGDILLIRNETTNESLLLKTIKENGLYKNIFSNSSKFIENEQWQQLEKDIRIRLIESTHKTVIIPSTDSLSTTDRIVNRWLKEAKDDDPFIVLVCGEKNMGKSTYMRYLINRSLNHVDSSMALTYFDCDVGQCEFTIGGCLSYITNFDFPLFGPPYSHIRSNQKPDRLLYYGHLSPQSEPVRYLEYVNKLKQLWYSDRTNQSRKRMLMIINTMGWGTGLGLELLKEVICMTCPKVIIQLGTDNNVSNRGKEQMPDITPDWLSKQPVFKSYRGKVCASDSHRKNYCERMNYEYVKIKSAAVMSDETSKLRPRDHRLLATWSYFFSSKLTSIEIPWSQVVHVSLIKDTNLVQTNLEHSIVGLNSNENIDQLKTESKYMDKIYQLFNYENHIFECLGFGWIQCSNQTRQTYEIYTPIDVNSNINLLIFGVFDTPNEFKNIFQGLSMK